MPITIAIHGADNGFFSLTDSADTLGSGQIFPRIYQCNLKTLSSDVLHPYRISFHNIYENQVVLEPSSSVKNSFNLTELIAGDATFTYTYTAVPNTNWVNRLGSTTIPDDIYKGIGYEPSVFLGGRSAKIDTLKRFDRFRLGTNDNDVFGVISVVPADTLFENATGFRVFIDRPLTDAQITTYKRTTALNRWVASTGIVAHFNAFQIITWKKPR